MIPRHKIQAGDQIVDIDENGNTKYVTVTEEEVSAWALEDFRNFLIICFVVASLYVGVNMYYAKPAPNPCPRCPNTGLRIPVIPVNR